MTPDAALPASSAATAARIARVAGETRTQRTTLAVASIGHLVPRTWRGRVHSTFARACNVECGELLLTIGARALGNGPTTIVLRRDEGDLRDRFAVGERVESREACMRSARIELDGADAPVWRPAVRRERVADAQLHARLRQTAAQLEVRRASQPNVLDRDAAQVVASLAAACAALDPARATASLDRLVGWGEGLTPAGDDCIVGVLAGLDVLKRGDPQRLAFRAAVAADVRARTHRTTPIAAHALRLAAAGHVGARIDRFVAALCCDEDDVAAASALHALLALGATSGADTATGVVAALCAWSQAPSLAEAA